MAKSIECKACGNSISLEEPKCPYCNAVNASKEDKQHNTNYQHSQQQNPQYQQSQQPQVMYVQQPQVVYVQPQQPQVFYRGKKGPFDKTTALVLCLFLGFFGAHKFYEGKVGVGILYLFTFGFFFMGVAIDLLALIFKPNKYYL